MNTNTKIKELQYFEIEPQKLNTKIFLEYQN